MVRQILTKVLLWYNGLNAVKDNNLYMPNGNDNNENDPKPQEDPAIIEKLANKSTDELLRIKTVFPFTLFPTEVVVDEVKITIIQNKIFFKHYFPVLVKDIKTVTVSYGLFFGSLLLEIQGYEQNPGPINLLKIKDALYAHQIIVGLTAVAKEKAEKALDTFPTEEKIEKLLEIGNANQPPAQSTQKG